MKESATYQEILREGQEIGQQIGQEIGQKIGEEIGRIQEARHALLLIGTKRFGQPDGQTVESIRAITSVEMLEKLMERLFEAENWTELLAG